MSILLNIPVTTKINQDILNEDIETIREYYERNPDLFNQITTLIKGSNAWIYTEMMDLSKRHPDVCVVLPEESIKAMTSLNPPQRLFEIMWLCNPSCNIYLPTENYAELLWGCINRTKRFVIIPLYLAAGESEAHANIFIYDKISNTIERFEPHGSETWYNSLFKTEELDKIAEKFFQLQINPNITYLPPSTFCPAKGPQVIEGIISNIFNHKISSSKMGSCSVWTFLYADLRLTYPDKTPQEIISLIGKKINKRDKDVYDFVVRTFFYLTDMVMRGYSQTALWDLSTPEKTPVKGGIWLEEEKITQEDAKTFLNTSSLPTRGICLELSELYIGDDHCPGVYVVTDEQITRRRDGEIFKACCSDNCEFVAKWNVGDILNSKKEANLQFLAAKKGIAPMIKKLYVCPKGCIIIMDKIKAESVADVFFLLTHRNQLEVLRKCCKVLNVLHKLGMVHGDSHLGNFMIDQEGKIFLIDFEYAYFPSEISSAKIAVQRDYKALLWWKQFDNKEQLEKLISIEENQDDFKFNPPMLDSIPENYKKPLVEEQVDILNIPNYNSI